MQHVHGLALAVQHVFVRRARGVHDDFVAHEAAVDVGKLLVGARAGGAGQAGAAGDVQRPGAVIDGHRVGQKILAQHIAQPLRAACVAGVGAPLLDQLAVVPDGKTDVGPRQRVAAHGLDAVGQFGGVGLQELAARRHAVEQLLDFHRGALRARHGLELARTAVQRISIGLAASARQQCDFSYRIDGSQRLAAKTHGAHRFQLGQAGDLAGGVALERGGHLIGRDAGAIVLHTDQAHAAGRQAQRDLRGPGIQRVVQQLAHHRRRALDHFAGGDLADQFIGQFADRAAGRWGHAAF